MMNNELTKEELLEEYHYLRVAAKQLFWAAQNIRAAAALRQPDIEDEIPKNQTLMDFNENPNQQI